MVLSTLLLFSTHCLLSSNALILSTDGDGEPGELLSSDVERRSTNPAGCAKKLLGSFNANGKSPVDELSVILEHGGVMSGNACSKRNENITWCPEPRTDPLLEREDQEWYGELIQYLKKELADTDESLPIVAAVWNTPLSADAQSAQVMNLACGFERLGMTKRFILFVAKGSLPSFRNMLPNITSVYHPLMDQFYDKIISRTGLTRKERIMKLAVAQMLLDVGRDVIITDTDVSWLRDSSSVLRDSGLNFAAMPDSCQHDINSGFLYYRNVEETWHLLHMALSTWRDPDLCADNDQYLLNCGWKRAAIKGLNYKVLPANGWSTKMANNICTRFPEVIIPRLGIQNFGIGDGYPYAYHTYGMSRTYLEELDMLAAFGLMDLDSKTGMCKKAPRPLSLRTVVSIFNQSCSMLEGGILHPVCHGDCKTEPIRSEEIVADLKSKM